MIGLGHYLTVSAILFGIGLFGILTRRNVLLVLLSIELMLNAVNLSFVAFAAHLHDLAGQAIVFFTMIVAACEVTVGLAMVVLFYRKKSSTDVDELDSMRW